MHNAKGLEFPIVFIAGLEEGLFPHSRSLDSETAMEEERRLCYVGMTRAEKKLHLSWARSRRRYGGGQPEPSIPSRFLKEAPTALVDRQRGEPLYSSSGYSRGNVDLYSETAEVRDAARRNLYTGKTYNSVDNIRQFFAERGMPAPQGLSGQQPTINAPAVVPRAATAAPKAAVTAPVKKKKIGPGSIIEHAKYGRGTVLRLEGTGDDTKLTVSFSGYGLKKLVAKYAGITIE
jgi:DNA helicase-2/ATP-dependent DNA helicase PcrA